MRKLTATVLTLTAFSSHADVTINSGGAAIGDYGSDRYFVGGMSHAFGGMTGVFATERNSTQTFSYAIPVAAGQQRITLSFRENCSSCLWWWKRVFSVQAEGQIILDGFSVAPGTTVEREFTVQSDSTLDLRFAATSRAAWVNAIRVESLNAEPKNVAPTLEFNAEPAIIDPGESVLLTWSTTDAETCRATEGWAGDRDTDGSELISPPASTTYGLTCSGEGGSVSEKVSVTLEQPNVPPSSSSPLSLLRVSPSNGRYFENEARETVVLSGSHTWTVLQDTGNLFPPRAFDYTGFLDFLENNGHNFLRMWTWEQSRWGGTAGDVWIDPVIFFRSGPGLALDGKPRFDVTRFNQEYFDRLRARVQQASARGIYVSVMLFNGWSLGYKGGASSNNPWDGHPFNRANNINEVDGDIDRDGEGHETHTLASGKILDLQKAYVAKVIDTVNDLNNVIYEISNESEANSTQWQHAMVDFIRTYEATKPNQHPIGMTAAYPGGSNSDLFNGPADWVSPSGSIGSPAVATGNKVILADTDHLCGVCGDRQWVWKSFTRGENPIFMDMYDFETPGQVDTRTTWEQVRRNLGYAVQIATEFDLTRMTPTSSTSVCSTGYCLADRIGGQFVIYAPSGGGIRVALPQGTFAVEWLRPTTGARTSSGAVQGGTRSFYAPFSGDAVLLLRR